MSKFVFLILFIAVADPIFAQLTVTDSLRSDGITRYYNLYIPKNHVSGSVHPLIIHLHGYGSNELIEQAYTNYMPIADTAGFLVVYPRGTTDITGRQYWNAGISGLPATPDDVQFISDLIDTIHQKYNIDLASVYASGLSNGGYMCYRLAWKLPNKIAAVASVSGSMSPADFKLCNPSKPVPVMEIHGTADSTVPYYGSVIATNIDSLMHLWVLADHCLPISDPISIPDTDPNDGSTVIHFEWTPQLLNESVQLYRVLGGSHVDWPGAGAGNNGDFSASPTIWQFFHRFQNRTSGVKEISAGSPFFNFFPDPCSDVLKLDMPESTTIFIFDVTGRLVITSREKSVDIRMLRNGVYFIRFVCNEVSGVNTFVKF